MALWRLYYHIVWATKGRHPLIDPAVESDLYGYIRGKAHALGCIVHAVGGMEDHIHLVVSIPPKLSIADFVQKIKGSSAHHLNQLPGYPKFGWQRGYGVFSLGGKQLPDAVGYVENQKNHHCHHTTIPALEKYAFDENGVSVQFSGNKLPG